MQVSTWSKEVSCIKVQQLTAILRAAMWSSWISIQQDFESSRIGSKGGTCRFQVWHQGELKIFTPMYYVLAEKIWTLDISRPKPWKLNSQQATHANLFQLERRASRFSQSASFAKNFNHHTIFQHITFCLAPVSGVFKCTFEDGVQQAKECCLASNVFFCAVLYLWFRLQLSRIPCHVKHQVVTAHRHRWHANSLCPDWANWEGVASSMLHSTSSIVGHQRTSSWRFLWRDLNIFLVFALGFDSPLICSSSDSNDDTKYAHVLEQQKPNWHRPFYEMSFFSGGGHGPSMLLIACVLCCVLLDFTSSNLWNFTQLPVGQQRRFLTTRHVSSGFLLFNAEATSKEKFMLSKLFDLLNEVPKEFKALDWQPQDSRGTRYFNAMDNRCVEYIAAGREDSWSDAAQTDFKSKGSRSLERISRKIRNFVWCFSWNVETNRYESHSNIWVQHLTQFELRFDLMLWCNLLDVILSHHV